MIYEYECAAGHVFELHRPVAESALPALCECGLTAPRIISATRGYVQRECRYDSPVDGRPISSWAERREDLARNDCIEYDPEMKKDAARFREASQKKLEDSVDASVEQAVMRMSGRQRERLGAELQGGADCTPVRESVDKSTVTRIEQ